MRDAFGVANEAWVGQLGAPSFQEKVSDKGTVLEGIRIALKIKKRNQGRVAG
jgi:hypothetical protein